MGIDGSFEAIKGEAADQIAPVRDLCLRLWMGLLPGDPGLALALSRCWILWLFSIRLVLIIVLGQSQ